MHPGMDIEIRQSPNKIRAFALYKQGWDINQAQRQRAFCAVRRSDWLAAPINIFSMPNFYNHHDNFFVIDFINYPIVALPYSISILS